LLANEFPDIRARLIAFRAKQTESVLAMSLPE
jgi:hypothetical protein